MRFVLPPHCTEQGVPADLSLGSHCLACIQAILEHGGERPDLCEQADRVQLARCLLRFLDWDHSSAAAAAAAGAPVAGHENYGGAAASIRGRQAAGDADDGVRISVRVYAVAVVKLLMQGRHTAERTEATVIGQGFGEIWNAFKNQSLDLYVSQAERRRLLLGDVASKFLEDKES